MTAPLPVDGPEARRLAGALVEDLRGAAPDALAPAGVDIGPAVEQVLFHAARGTSAPRTVRSPTWPFLRVTRALATGLRPGPTVEASDVLVVLLAGVHARLFDPVGRALSARRPTLRLAAVTAGRAARDPSLRTLPDVAVHPGWREAAALFRAGGAGTAVSRATAGWDGALGLERAATLRRAAADAVARLAVEAIRLDATFRRARPAVAVTYDEIDAWGRLVCAVARRHDTRVVDLPHAEAVDADAIRGAAYDAMGAFGPRAARVLEAAGVPRDRVAVVGPARFDALLQAPPRPVDRPYRVLLAAQYRVREMTDALRAEILAAAVAAAGAVDGTVEIAPHPVEPATSWESLLSALPTGGPAVRVAADAGLHDLLPGAALLVTGWSNSVYEAVLAGVPAMTVHPGPGDPPMPFATEGIATQVGGTDDARATAAGLILEPGRSRALERARAALGDHLGPLDGLATIRSAELIERVLAA
jgi:hypothetical protein